MGEIAKVVGGSTPRSKEPAYWGGDIPWLGVADLTGYTEKHISRGARSITQAGYDSCATQMLPTGSVLFSSRAPIGYVAIAAQPLCTSQGFKSFVLKDGVSSDYVYWYLRHAKDLAESMASGTTFRELSGRAAALLPIPVPPRAEQDRIVSRLEACFAAVRVGSRELETAADRLALFRSAAIEAELGNFWGTDSVARPGWRFANPDEIARDTSNALAIGPFGSNLKVSDYRESGVPLVFVRNIRDGSFTGPQTRYVDTDKATELSSHHVEGGDVLVTKMGGPPGDACVYPKGFPSAVITADCIRFAVAPDVLSPTLAALLFETRFVQRQVAQRSKGVAQQKISLRTFKTLHLPVPPAAEQHEILTRLTERLGAHESMSRHLAAVRADVDQLTRSLLHHAFTGRLPQHDP